MATRRPWSQSVARLKATTKPKTAEPPRTWKVVKGDRVQVISGQDAGTTGEVLRVIRPTGNLLVENVNMRKKLVPANEQNPKPTFLRFETPIHVSRVSLLDPTDGLPCKVKIVRDEATGKRVRVSRRTGELIPKPVWVREGLEDRSAYEEQLWDTKAGAVLERTYTPSALSFEEEVIQALGLDLNKATVNEDDTSTQ